MNQLFLLIPAVNERDAGQDIAYLKLLGDVSTDDVIGFFRKVKECMSLINEEDVEIIYDHKHLRSLNEVLKEKRERNSDVDEMPQVGNLLAFLSDAVSIQDRQIGNTPIKVNAMQVGKGLVNAYIECGIEHNSLLNKEALNNEHHPLEVEVANETKQLKVLSCDASDVYLWLVKNRYPSRKLDPNYKKHTKKEKLGKKGAKISSISYTKKQLEAFLRKAVSAGKDLRELYYKDNERDKIIVFWDENLETPSYHAFEIEANDHPEIQKMLKRGGQCLINKVEITSKII